MTPLIQPADERSFVRAGYPLKRPLDVVLSLLGLTLLLLPMVVISFLILVASGRPVFFKQQRPGLRARPFTILKFRTMRQGTGADAERLSRLGRFLRRTSLDELPELWNVLKGDMSLVGPRPLLIKYLPYYTEQERVRFLVRPGLTGLPQVMGRNLLDWDSRLALDVRYFQRVSFVEDLRIMIMTVWVVLTRRGLAVDSRLVEPALSEVRSRAVSDVSDRSSHEPATAARVLVTEPRRSRAP